MSGKRCYSGDGVDASCIEIPGRSAVGVKDSPMNACLPVRLPPLIFSCVKQQCERCSVY